jgi:PleD family two-component response regulator
MATILFADDDSAMRRLVADALEARGHEVRVVSDGRSALAQVGTAPPQAVVLDVRMGAPDGVEVCRRLRSDPALSHLPIILLTGENRPDDRLRGFEAGADDYLGKPFDPRELVARVEALLRRSRRDLERNPTSGLPGGERIRLEIERRLDAGHEVSLCYFDVDHFKPFGDRFGFTLGDRAIRAVADAIRAGEWGADAFVGHVGGDDFVTVCRRTDAADLARRVRKEAGERIAELVPDEVRRAGSYLSRDRAGQPGHFPLPRVSVAVLHLPPGSPAGDADLGERMAELKLAAKLSPEGIAEARSAV